MRTVEVRFSFPCNLPTLMEMGSMGYHVLVSMVGLYPCVYSFSLSSGNWNESCKFLSSLSYLVSVSIAE